MAGRHVLSWCVVSEEVPPERLRASDSDRARVLDALRDAVADGRIDMDEFTERSDRVQTARTLGELPEATADLLPTDRQPIRLDPQPVLALMTTLTRRGRWVAYPDENVVAVAGRVEIDLREALFLRNHQRLNITALFGLVEIDVPEGVEVRITGRSFLGLRTTTARASDRPRPPVLEITGLTLFGMVRVRAPRRRRRLGPVRRHRITPRDPA